MSFPAQMPVQNCSSGKILSAARMKAPSGDPGNSSSVRLSVVPAWPARLLSPDTNAPLPHEFCRAVLNPQIEFLGASAAGGCCALTSGAISSGGAAFSCGNASFSRRFRKTLAGDGKPFFKVIEIEPPLRARFQIRRLPITGKPRCRICPFGSDRPPAVRNR